MFMCVCVNLFTIVFVCVCVSYSRIVSQKTIRSKHGDNGIPTVLIVPNKLRMLEWLKENFGVLCSMFVGKCIYTYTNTQTHTVYNRQREKIGKWNEEACAHKHCDTKTVNSKPLTRKVSSNVKRWETYERLQCDAVWLSHFFYPTFTHRTTHNTTPKTLTLSILLECDQNVSFPSARYEQVNSIELNQ